MAYDEQLAARISELMHARPGVVLDCLPPAPDVPDRLHLERLHGLHGCHRSSSGTNPWRKVLSVTVRGSVNWSR